MKKKVIYLQEDAYSCGSVCIQSVVSHYGGYIPLETVLDDTNTDRTGTNAFEMVRALKKYGFTAYGCNVSVEKIDTSLLPVIAHVIKNGLEHFLVIYEIDEVKVTVMDPECGMKTYSLLEFESIYDNKAIYIHKEGEIPHYETSKTLINSLLKTVQKHKAVFITVTVLSLLSIGLNLLTSFHLKLLNSLDMPLKVTSVFVMLRFVVYIVLVVKDHLLERLKEAIDVYEMDKLTGHIFALPMRFLGRKRTGEMVKKIEDASFIRSLCFAITVDCSLDMLLLCTSLVLMICLSGRLAFLYLGISLLIAIISYKTSAHLYKRNKENVRLYDEYSGKLVEQLSGIESIKNLSREEKAMACLSASLKEYTSNRRKLNNYILNMNETKSFILEAGQLVTNLIGFLSLSDTFTFFDLITIQSLFGLFTSSQESIFNILNHLHRGKAIYKSASEFLDIKEETKDGIVLSPLFDHLKVVGLSYSYDGINKSLASLNIDIRRGDKILIKGPSGIGKSTLVKCLCGRFQNYEGLITINDIDIKKVRLQSLRQHIVYVGQEEKLFSGTVEENITAGEKNEEQLAKVLYLSDLDEFIENRKEGKNAYILEGATNLSGGERSRICLARALYKKPSIIIIDETLSSVSEEMEDDILSKLLNESDLTVISITHRNKEQKFKKIIELRKE